MKSVVAHVDHERIVIDTHLFQLLPSRRSDAVVDAAEGFAISLVDSFNALAGMQRKVHPVPTVPLIEQPARTVFQVVGSTVRLTPETQTVFL